MQFDVTTLAADVWRVCGVYKAEKPVWMQDSPWSRNRTVCSWE